jgi:integrase
MDISFQNKEKLIVSKLNEYSYYARGAFSENTQKSYKYNWNVYTKWCLDNKRKALPADYKTIVDFIDDMAKTKKVATITSYLATISKAHRMIDHDGSLNPCAGEPVKLAMKRLKREKGIRQKQAEGLVFNLRNRLIGSAGDSLIDKRNKAIVAIAYDTGFRVSEIISLNIEDIEYKDNGTALVLLKRSKTDQEGKGQYRFIPTDTCSLLKDWINSMQKSNGPLFRTIKHKILSKNRMCRVSIRDVFKKMAKKADLPKDLIDRISCHSSRVGMAQDLMLNGMTMAQIMQAGGWKSSSMISRYTERINAEDSAMAKLAKYQNRL